MQFLQQLKSKLKNKFVKNVITLFSGSVIGQGIIFLTIPILTRLFSKEAFGVLAIYTSIVMISKIIISLRFELTIVLPKREKDAINLFALNILVISVLSGLLFFIILFFHDSLVRTLKIEKISYFIFFVPLSTFFIGIISAIDYWNNRIDKYKKISIGVISKSITTSFSQLSIGLSSFKSVGLVPGAILGQLVQFVILSKTSYKSLFILTKYISIKRMFFLASKYRDIPIFNTIVSFTNTLSNEIPVLLIGRFFGVSYVGVYGLAIKFSKIIPGHIGKSISQVFFNEASKTYNNGNDLFQLIKKTYKHLFLLALFIFIPIFGISFFLDIIFGENWYEVGLYVRIILPWLFLGFLSFPVSSLITILNKQKIILFLDLSMLILRFLAIYIGYSIYNNIYVSLSLYSIVGVVFNFIILFYFYKISKEASIDKKPYQ